MIRPKGQIFDHSIYFYLSLTSEMNQGEYKEESQTICLLALAVYKPKAVRSLLLVWYFADGMIELTKFNT